MAQEATCNVGVDVQPNAQGELDVVKVRQWLEKEVGVKVENQGALYLVDEGHFSEAITELKGDTIPAHANQNGKVNMAIESRTVQMAANHIGVCCLGDGDPYAEPSDCTNSGPSAHSQPATQSPIGGGVEWMPMSSDMQS
eukprot:g52057.t1